MKLGFSCHAYRTSTFSKLIRRTAIAMALCVFCATTATAQSSTTQVDELVMYCVDADTNQLMKYKFSTQSFIIIGSVEDSQGTSLEDMEGLVHIPAGPHAGLYVAPIAGDHAYHLAKVDPTTAVATVVGSPMQLNGSDVAVNGMIAHNNGGNWSIRATLSSDSALIDIDPATGDVSLVASLDRGYAGLAQGANGNLYAIQSDDFYHIDPITFAQTLVSSHAFGKTEGLEYAFGDYAPRVDIPNVPASWTANGVLFGFSDDNDALLVFNPATGEALDVNVSFASFVTVDCEGIVFVTQMQDNALTQLEVLFD